MAESIYEKAMRLLHRPITKAADPDDADSRVGGDAEPTDKKLAEAGEEAAAGGQAGAQGGEGAPEGEGGVPANPGEGEGEGEGSHSEPDGDEGQGGSGDGDGDESEDMSPDEVRELRKAFGLTDHDEIDETKKDNNIPDILKSILSYVQKSDAFMQNLTKELADLKAKHSSGKADEDLRVTMKAFQDDMNAKMAELREAMVSPRTAPAAAQPKGFSKAIQTEAPAEKKLTLADITNLALRKEITATEAARLTRMVNHNIPA